MKNLKYLFLLAIVLVASSLCVAGNKKTVTQWLSELPNNNTVYMSRTRYIQDDATNYEIDISTDVNVTGTITGSGLTTVSSMTVTNTCTVGTLTDGTASLTSGAITGLLDFTSSSGTVTNTATVGTLTDGTASLTGGTATGLLDLTSSSGTITNTATVGTLTDGTASLTSGAITGLLDFTSSSGTVTNTCTVGTLTDGTASLTAGTVTGLLDFTSSSGTVTNTCTVGTLTDGTASLTAGAVTGLLDFTSSSGTITNTATVGTLTDGTASLTGGVITSASMSADQISAAALNIGANAFTVNSIEIVGSDGEVNAAAIEDKFLRNDGDDTTTGQITCVGLVAGDGNITTNYGVSASTFVIGANTLSTTEWAFLDGQDQSTKTTDDVVFAKLTLNADFNLNSFVVMTDSGTVTISSSTVILATKAGAMEIDLPDAATSTGKIFTIKKTDANASIVSLDANGGTVDGADPYNEIDAQYDFVAIISDGTNWHIIGKYITP